MVAYRPFTVFIVDDDAAVLKAMSRLLKAEQFDTRCFPSARDFMAGYDASISGCALVDLAMDGIDGLQLQEQIVQTRIDIPIIFLTGTGDISSSVRAMKAGAVDFLTKPVSRDALLSALTKAMDVDEQKRRERAETRSISAKLATLTSREREVFDQVAAGRLNKQIAGALGVVEKTVKVHRARMMRKLGLRTIADLVRLSERAVRETSKI
jgi:FixJ family two-component response regulator